MQVDLYSGHKMVVVVVVVVVHSRVNNHVH